MIGAGTLFRFAGRAGGRILDRLGVLPPRWYLKEALEALSQDDLPRVIRSLGRARVPNSHRWELIRQQAVFRCRILNEAHERSVRRLEKCQEAGRLEGPPANDLGQVIELHRLAIRLLSRYEASLQGLALPSITQVNQAWLK